MSTSVLGLGPILCEPSREKTNIMASAECIDSDQLKHAARLTLIYRQCSSPVDLKSVSGIITLYLYPPETECVGPDQFVRTAQADMNGYITQRS